MSDWEEKDRPEAGFIKELQGQTKGHPYMQPNGDWDRPMPIDDKIEEMRNHKRHVLSDKPEKQQRSRELLMRRIVVFAATETLAGVGLVLLQGFSVTEGRQFKLDALSFRLILVAMLGQATVVLAIAIWRTGDRG